MKSIFPTVYSTLCPTALGLLLQENYQLEKVVCKLFLRGVGDTYTVDSLIDPFILRIYRSSHRSLPQIEAEVDLLLALQQAGVSVSYPIKDKYGNYILALDAAEGTRHAVLFSFAKGNVESNLNTLQLQNLGYEMAAFHTVSSTIKLNDTRWELNLETTLLQPLATLKPYFKADETGYEWWQTMVEKVINQLSQFDINQFSVGYCHYDFLAKNFHFDGDQVTLFDFDFMGRGWLVNDIMTFWQHLCLDVHFKRITQQAADEAYHVFISAYKEKRFVSDAELAAVPYLSLGFWLFYSAFHTTHDVFYQYVQPAHLKLRTGLIKDLMERYWVETPTCSYP